MEEFKKFVSLATAKLLKKAGYCLGSDHSYVKQAFMKHKDKKLWGKFSRVDDVLYYCHAEDENGVKLYPDAKESDWITWKYVISEFWWRNSEESFTRSQMYEAPSIFDVMAWLEKNFHICISIRCNGYKSYMYEIREFHLVGSEWQEKHYEFGMPKREADRYSVENDAITVALKRIIEEKGKQKEDNSINT